MRMTGNNVLLSPVFAPTQTSSGIIIAEQYRVQNKTYKVLAVGPGKTIRKKGKPDRHVPIEVKVGDTVISGLYQGSGLIDDGHGRLVVDADQILAVVEHG